MTSDVFVYGRSHPNGSEDISPMSTINFDDLLGRMILFPTKRATISDHINTISQDHVSREDQLRFKLKLMKINLMILFHTINLWNT